MDHHFQGRPVLPAVEAMDVLARIAQKKYPRLRVDHITAAGFEKFLFMDPEAGQLDALVEIKTFENGTLQAILLTRTKSPKAAFTRTKIHVRMNFEPSPAMRYYWLRDMAAALEGICTTIPPGQIYHDLVPFGPTFQNIQAPLYISPDGALARIQTPPQKHHHPEGSNVLGSGYALDAAFHAACVWSQHYRGIVAFPVAVDRRTIISPTRPAKTYFGRIMPQKISGELLIFDILLLDENGLLCETVEGVHMRDVSGGRLQPPDWIHHKDQPDPLENLRKACREIAVVELDAVASFAPQALTPLEKERLKGMGARRRRSYLAARLALKRLYRRLRKDDGKTPADQIETVQKDSALPCIGPMNSSQSHHCSVSHDRRFAIAVAAPRAVGVDVEVICPKALKSTSIFMSTAEQKMIRQSPMDEMSAAVRIWSIKEATAKATGINLAEAWTRVRITAVGEKESCLTVDEKTMTAKHAVIDEHLFTLICV